MPYRTLENVIDGVVITFTDSTAAKLLEATLREQANQLRQMADALPNLVLGCRPDGSCDHVGRQWLAFTGVPEAEQVGYGWLDQVHPEERERVRDEWKAMLRSNKVLDSELRMRGADGAFRWFNARSVAIRDGSGAIVKWYLTCSDVEELKGGAEGRRLGVPQLPTLFDGLQAPFVAVNTRHVVTQSNAAAERMLERPGRELLDKDLFDVWPVLERAAFETKLEEAASTRRAVSLEVTANRRGEKVTSRVHIVPDSGGLCLVWQR
jgi:PAS domain S-box-containing protein